MTEIQIFTFDFSVLDRHNCFYKVFFYEELSFQMILVYNLTVFYAFIIQNFIGNAFIKQNTLRSTIVLIKSKNASQNMT